jgi:hypothetical protein
VETTTSETTWGDWVQQTLLVCAMHPDETPRLIAWSGILNRAGWTPEQANAAVEWVKLNESVSRYDLLAALQKRLKAQATLKPSEAGPTPENEACAICGGLDREGYAREATGRVIVPDPDDPRGDKDVVVYCRCPLGRWYRSSAPAIKVRGKECQVLTIDDIHDRFTLVGPAPDGAPGWRGWKEWRRRRDQELHGAAEEARLADRQNGPLQRLVQQWRMQ